MPNAVGWAKHSVPNIFYAWSLLPHTGLLWRQAGSVLAADFLCSAAMLNKPSNMLVIL